MTAHATGQAPGSAPPVPDCVELGIWTPIPVRPPKSLRLRLKDVDRDESRAIRKRGVMTFHAVGCTGCHTDHQATNRVAGVLAEQARHPHQFGGHPDAVVPSFLYHLGDVAYHKDKETVAEQSPPETHTDFGQFYDEQFYSPYAGYSRPIFAIPGNHDGKNRDPGGPFRKSAIHHFLKNFCGLEDGDPADNRSSTRAPMRQPYPYWLLRTPLAWFVGLYANVNNAGHLDDPQSGLRPQYDWLVRTLTKLGKARDRRALILAIHYPPYSAAVNFRERGNPNLGPSPRPAGMGLEPLAETLQRAFRESGHRPDVVLSAHAHHYQRLTYTDADGRQIPYLIAGGGGHSPLEKFGRPCLHGAPEQPRAAPGPVSLPDWLNLPRGDTLDLVAWNDEDFGFLRLTLDGKARRLTGEYFAAFSATPAGPLPALADSFTLDLHAHQLG